MYHRKQQGNKNRQEDPKEEFDQAAAELTGQPEQYLELMILMKQYENAATREERITIRNMIETIIGLNADTEMFEAMDLPEMDEIAAKAVFAEKDKEVKKG